MDAGIQDAKIVGEDVWLTVPPFSEYLRTVRLVAADAAGRAGLDYDAIEDFRIAVDELCHLLMSSTDHEISVSFGVSPLIVARTSASIMPGRGRSRISRMAWYSRWLISPDCCITRGMSGESGGV